MKKLLPSLIAAFLLSAPAALAASHYLKVSPGTANAGSKVRVYGSVGTGCGKGSQVTLYSKAFKGSTSHNFAGVPAVYTKAGNNGSFSVKVTIQGTTASGHYSIGGRCGGGNFGHATLKVTGLGFY